MHLFFLDHDIECQRTCIYTRHQNGIVECEQHHILTVAWSLLYQSNLPIHFLGNCVLTAVYLINRLPSPIQSVTLIKHPFNYYRTKFRLLHIHVFSKAYVMQWWIIPNTNLILVLDDASLLDIHLIIKATDYMILKTNTIFYSRDVVFHETIFPFHEITSLSHSYVLQNL